MKGIERSVVWLGEEESDLARAWMLSIEGDGFGNLKVNYPFVKDFCVKHDLDSVDIFDLFKRMAGEIRRE